MALTCLDVKSKVRLRIRQFAFSPQTPDLAVCGGLSPWPSLKRLRRGVTVRECKEHVFGTSELCQIVRKMTSWRASVRKGGVGTGVKVLALDSTDAKISHCWEILWSPADRMVSSRKMELRLSKDEA